MDIYSSKKRSNPRKNLRKGKLDMNKRKIIALVLALAMSVSMLFGFAACGGDKGSDTTDAANTDKKYADQITVQVGPNPETLDPALNSSVDGGNMLITLFETLLIIDEDNNVQPGQAEKYEVSDDGLVWTFTMRDGLKWSDGTDLDAKDFEYTFKRVVDTSLAAPYAETVCGMIDGYTEAIGNPDDDGNTTTEPNADLLNVKASDDGKTLTITLAYPCSYFDKIVAFATLSPVQKATVDANGDAWATDAATYICNGPYMIEKWTPGESILLKKNPYYNGGWDNSKIVTNHINFLLLEDSSAAYAAYTSGEALMIKDVPTDEIASLTKAEDGGDFYVDPILGTYYISLNLDKEIFQNKNVRKALSLAIDREYVANTVMGGTYSPAYDFIGPGVVDNEGYFEENGSKSRGGSFISTDYEANLEEAKKALAEAGYPNGEGFPVITYSTNDSGYHVPLAEYLQDAYKQLGITMNIEKVEWSSFTPQRRAGNYEMARNGWVMDYNDASNMLELFVTTNGNNDGNYSNPDYNAAIEKSKTADKAAHYEALHEAEEIILEDYGMIPVAYYNDFWLQSSKLEGSWHSPYGYWYFQYAYSVEA